MLGIDNGVPIAMSDLYIIFPPTFHTITLIPGAGGCADNYDKTDHH